MKSATSLEISVVLGDIEDWIKRGMGKEKKRGEKGR